MSLFPLRQENKCSLPTYTTHNTRHGQSDVTEAVRHSEYDNPNNINWEINKLRPFLNRVRDPDTCLMKPQSEKL